MRGRLAEDNVVEREAVANCEVEEGELVQEACLVNEWAT